MNKFVVLPSCVVNISGTAYPEGSEIELDDDVAAFHVKANTLRPYFSPADSKTAAPANSANPAQPIKATQP